MLAFIEANDFRNFAKFSLELSPKFNVISGLNGSGKSTILESIYFLSLARSFRTHVTNHVIQYQKNTTVVSGVIRDSNNLKVNVGVQKKRNGETEIHVNGEASKTPISLAKLLPAILLNPDSYTLIHGGPVARRQFLNWAVFHVEQSFISIWKNFHRCLKQRNTALKTGLSVTEVQFWDKEFIELSLMLDKLYLNYVESLTPEVQDILRDLTNLDGISLEYYSGWNKAASLDNLLKESSFRERQQGYTLIGPHRADLKITFKGSSAQEILSRGEQKLLVFAMQLAQARLLDKIAGIKVVYLIDDLAAELDAAHRKKIIDFLISLDAQVFLTCLDPQQIYSELPLSDLKMFHVEHGVVKLLTVVNI